MMKPELLAPAGDLEKLAVALHYGADAVYIGGREFSLRARASNFDLESIEEAVKIAHQHQKKLYVTTNIIPRNDDFEGFIDYIKTLESIEVDALICASPSVVSLIKQHTNLEVHLSTQQSVTNALAINFWQSEGIQRIVLARELTLNELKVLRQHTDIELEVFIHGGMCVAYSGRCVLSNVMTDRDANRGGCAHSCRWNYTLFKNHKPLESSTPFSMSSKDLQSIQHIETLMKIGIESLKIEGRMKSIHYIATVVNAYRHLIDAIFNKNQIDLNHYIKLITKAENRFTSDGFLGGMTSVKQQLYNQRNEQPTQAFIGFVKDYEEQTQRALIEQRNYFEVGDQYEIFTPEQTYGPYTIASLETLAGHQVTVARHPQELLWLHVSRPLRAFDMIRKV